MRDLPALRPRLFGIAYRILGSISDAEDVVQSAYLRLEEHRNDDIRHPDAWLTTVTARIAIGRARLLSRRRESYIGLWLPEPIIEKQQDPLSEMTLSDDLTMGFLHVLERLRPEERTAMLLHDVFDYSHAEIARILGKSVEAVRQLASRARDRVHEERPRVSIDRFKAVDLTQRFLRALDEANLEELHVILATDVVAMADGGGKASAGLHPTAGIQKVTRLLLGLHAKYWSAFRVKQHVVNGLPGVCLYLEGSLFGVIAFDYDRDHITSVFIVVNPDKLVWYTKRSPVERNELL